MKSSLRFSFFLVFVGECYPFRCIIMILFDYYYYCFWDVLFVFYICIYFLFFFIIAFLWHLFSSGIWYNIIVLTLFLSSMSISIFYVHHMFSLLKTTTSQILTIHSTEIFSCTFMHNAYWQKMPASPFGCKACGYNLKANCQNSKIKSLRGVANL